MKNRIISMSLAIALVFSVGLIGCGGEQISEYSLTISSTEGGSVTTPGEGIFTYYEGSVVNLLAEAEEGHQFVNWTGDVGTIANVNAASTTIIMSGGYVITANFAPEILRIRDWYDLDAIRENLGGSYILMNDLDSTTTGYEELASPTANAGRGWQPIGSFTADWSTREITDSVAMFSGSLDGQGYEIRDLFIHRFHENGVGLVGLLDEEGMVQNLAVMNANVTGNDYVGSLVGYNRGTVQASYCTGSVTGETVTGSLVGFNKGSVTDSHSSTTVVGTWGVGGLIGWNTHGAIISNSYATGGVTAETDVGGLAGHNDGAVNDSFFSGSITGESAVGGLVGWSEWGAVSNSHYNYDEVFINGKNTITVGALYAEDFDEWLANGKALDANERFAQENGYFLIENIADFKQLLAFGQDRSLRFRLTNDLDLSNEPNFYVPYLAGQFNGDGHRISNLTLDSGSVRQVGLFGCVASGAAIYEVGVENINVVGGSAVGGLAGASYGTVSNAYSHGSVTGNWQVGGLIGSFCEGTLSNSYFSGSVTSGNLVGGLIGCHAYGIINNSYYNYDDVLINGQNIVTIGALFGEDFEQWLANNKSLDVDERLSQESGYYVIDSLEDFRELLAFGQHNSLSFRLKNDLDLAGEPGFYIPYLAGEFDGDGHRILNLSLNYDFADRVGLFGHLAPGGIIDQVGAENVKITGGFNVGGLVGYNLGTVSNSYSTGSITAHESVGGLVGWNTGGTVSNSYSGASVTGHDYVGGLVGDSWGGTITDSYSTGTIVGVWRVGGLTGWNYQATVSRSYSSSSVTGTNEVGGLVGGHYEDTAINSFWDTQSSGQATSDGGTGKTTAEMKSIAAFSGAGWNIVAVANPGTRNPSYIWNIVDGQTYPFLSWQSVS